MARVGDTANVEPSAVTIGPGWVKTGAKLEETGSKRVAAVKSKLPEKMLKEALLLEPVIVAFLAVPSALGGTAFGIKLVPLTEMLLLKPAESPLAVNVNIPD